MRHTPTARAAAALGALWAAASILSFAPPVTAQPEPADSTSEARIAFAQGVESFEAERFEEALRDFLRAWQLRPHPTVRVNLASCYAKLGRAPAAVLHYRAYLSDRNVQISRAARREIQGSLAQLEPRVGAIDLILSPADARVTVDGEEPDARDGSRVFVLAGTHRFEASAAGHGILTRTVEVAGGSTQSLSIELPVAASTPPAPPEPPPERATEPPPPPPERAAEPADTGDAAASIEPTPAERPGAGGGGRTVARWTAFGLAGAAVAGAAVLGVLALGADSDFDAGASRMEKHDYATESERAAIDRQARDDAKRARALALWTDVCVGVAAAAAITGTVLLLTAPSTPPADEALARVHLAVSPTGASVSLTGTF